MDSVTTSAPVQTFPWQAPPGEGEMAEVAPGILWLRLTLPFRLNHVNIYLIEDGDGLALVDCGIGNDDTRAIWDALLTGPLKTRPLTRIIATHAHPDHVGMAGWLCERLDIPLLMSQTEYLGGLIIQRDPGSLNAEPYRSFYLGHGLDPDVTERLLTNGHRYLRMTTALPRTFRRLIAGETLQIGARRFDVLTGGGHSPEQVMLYCAAETLLLSADQVLARITPNIGAQAMDPDGDPLGIYLRSLAGLKQTIPATTLTLPGHELPFTELHLRIDELIAHHALRCDAILQACRARPHSAAELVPVVFGRSIDDPHQMGFAFSEALAHVNLLRREGRLRNRDGRYIAAS